jgi:hypothetical protein
MESRKYGEILYDRIILSIPIGERTYREYPGASDGAIATNLGMLSVTFGNRRGAVTASREKKSASGKTAGRSDNP